MPEQPRDPGVSIWVAPPKARRRGSAPTGLSRDRIVRAAVALLDADGVPAFSMRRLAGELDVTPMSVYWYVDNKDDLLELALDEAFGEMVVPPLGEGDDWRAHLRTMAAEYRRCFQRHPWAAQLAGRFLALGPNAVFFSTSAVAAVSRSGLSGDALGAGLGLVIQYAYGFALAEAQWMQRVHDSGRTEDELHRDVHGIVARSEARYLEDAPWLRAEVEGGVAAGRDRQFELGLDMALAGLDAFVRAPHDPHDPHDPR
ncbi:TetR/AcrR family transcriptional regulator [Kitasatospora sp. NPDC094015]|uniref:TetR/AcrR family transcriptional regulator n=1 Tax=Kitasatospora sp. NPDC094015 TaxID=3155205 RepID=UPI0033217AB7